MTGQCAIREEGESSGHENLQLFNKHLTKSALSTCKVRALAIPCVLRRTKSVWYWHFPFFAQRFEVDVRRVSPQFHLCLTWSRSSRVTARISCRRRSWHKSPPGRKSSAGSKSRRDTDDKIKEYNLEMYSKGAVMMENLACWSGFGHNPKQGLKRFQDTRFKSLQKIVQCFFRKHYWFWHIRLLGSNYPPPSNSHHQDYYIFSRESQPKPSFVTFRGG